MIQIALIALILMFVLVAPTVPWYILNPNVHPYERRLAYVRAGCLAIGGLTALYLMHLARLIP